MLTELGGSDDALAGLHVLIVEDETLVSMLLEDMVEDLGGVVVESAPRIARALEIARDAEIHIDLALLDVNLGGEDAFPVAEVLLERGVPFAFSTGYGNSGLPERWRQTPTLQKPFTLEQVSGVLRRVLEDRADAANALPPEKA
jgi:DNA-binding NtrC family response regulator